MQLHTRKTTFEGWSELISMANHTIMFAEYYWTLTDGRRYPPEDQGWQGEAIYHLIEEAHARGVQIKIIQNQPSSTFPNVDSQRLANAGMAEVRSLDFKRLPPQLASGIFHTKLIIVDSAHFYVGSANMDWRSLEHVKELGTVVKHSTVLADDLVKLFKMWWEVAESNSIPVNWPGEMETVFTEENPAHVIFDGGMKSSVFFAVSPPHFCTHKRAKADDTTVAIINRAKKFVDIEVMDYQPTSLYYSTNYYWPEIDDALRSAAFRGVTVRLLVSRWNHTSRSMFQYVSSLDSLNNADVRWFVVPDLEGSQQIPFSRVNHAKFLVTEEEAYISNNNWTADYFKSTAGVTMVLRNPDVVDQLHREVFERDWNSIYAHEHARLPPPRPAPRPNNRQRN
eukprot:TRINITY_DN3072_c0_g2_i2.p1 TRINITY_DN3072_c0_g2~~TRINITY_DN3072_c0_g2_i2.p1  ORF type:complete len:395 (-),score=92.19 TRINITY_DN3072_c0_g2_i2:79-1263(-)